MRLEYTPEFFDDYRELSSVMQSRVDSALRKLSTDIHYPGLRVKKMKGYRGIWEARVSRSHRVTFQIRDDRIIVRRVGAHDIEDNP